LHGTRIQRKRVIGAVERYQDETAARAAVTVLLGEINSDKLRMGSRSITVAQLCDHFEQRELAKDNTWRSYATKKTYQAYLTRWVLPHWREDELAEINTADLYNNENQYRRSDVYGDCGDPNQGCVIIRIVSDAKGSIPSRVKRARLK
jgi:hypothetical protein